MGKLVSPNQVGSKGNAANGPAPAKGKVVSPGGPAGSRSEAKGR